MSGKGRDLGMDSLARSMDDTIEGEPIEVQEMAQAVDSGQVEAREQQMPRDAIKRAPVAKQERDDQPS